MWCRSLVEVWSKSGRSLVEVWCRSLVNMLSILLCVSLIYRANFDQTSTLGGVEVWSKFRPNFDTGGSKFGRNSEQTSTPTSFMRSAQCAARSAQCAVRSAQCAVRSAQRAVRTQGYLEGYLRYLEGFLEGYLQQQRYTLKDTFSNNHDIYLGIPSMYMRYREGPLGKQRYLKRYLEKHSEHWDTFNVHEIPK